MRQTIKEIEVTVAYRWFSGYSLTEPVPHFSTFGKNYIRRFAASDIFERILSEAEKAGNVDASAVFIDSMHIKASANKHKSKEVKVIKSIKQYRLELEAVTRKVSTTDLNMNVVLPKVRKRLATNTALFWTLK